MASDVERIMASDVERTKPARKMLRQTLLVGNLPSAAPEELEAQLRRAFKPYGNLVECEVLVDAFHGHSRGYAFMRLHERRQAERAKRELDGTLMSVGTDERLVRVRWSLDTHTLCVSDLGPDITAQILQDAFEQFGHVVSCRLEHEPDEFGGHSKLFGFVEFSSRAIASKVQQLLMDNLFVLGNSPRPMRVDFAVDEAFDDAEGAPVAPDLKPPPPHFAVPGSLEFDFALRWRELALAHQAERERLSEVHRQEREILRQEQQDIYHHEQRKLRMLEQPVAAAMSLQEPPPLSARSIGGGGRSRSDDIASTRTDAARGGSASGGQGSPAPAGKEPVGRRVQTSSSASNVQQRQAMRESDFQREPPRDPRRPVPSSSKRPRP